VHRSLILSSVSLFPRGRTRTGLEADSPAPCLLSVAAFRQRFARHPECCNRRFGRGRNNVRGILRVGNRLNLRDGLRRRRYFHLQLPLLSLLDAVQLGCELEGVILPVNGAPYLIGKLEQIGRGGFLFDTGVVKSEYLVTQFVLLRF
jgi:hypothetical protein